ncbi:conserved hypothetical protein [uncultured Paludibacter sp.]|nr:conserved hypothetical protein [uncultured Paludibacter sp.]
MKTPITYYGGKQRNLFETEIENEAIKRIIKFSLIAKSMNFDVCLGFSGGKDSQVIYDLCCRSGIDFKAYFNHSFESSITLQFIKEHYPNVIWRHDHKFGFIENIWKNHSGLLPTIQRAYCCSDYKHNSKYVDKCSIVGVRKIESQSRKMRTTIEVKNKTILKKNKVLFNSYFEENCQSIGTQSIIQLKPIIDWTDDDVWNYLKKYKLPINPEYKKTKRVGCVVCPKANFNSNYYGLIENPKLIDAFIRAKEKGKYIDWYISGDKKDYSNDKCYYICRWLNHSFMPFTKSQEAKYTEVKNAYNKIKSTYYKLQTK